MPKRTKRKKNGFRLTAVFIWGLFFIVCAKLFVLQVVTHQEHLAYAERSLKLTVPVVAPRGEIKDRYGTPIVTNRPGYFVVLSPNAVPLKEQNNTILKVLALINQTTNEAPPSETKRLCKTYQIAETYTEEEKQILCNVYFGLEQQNTAFYTLAEDVTIETATTIAEQPETFAGVFLQERPVRTYRYPTSCVHLLGHVGSISAEEYEAKKQEGYRADDVVGKQGAEKAFEHYLRGVNGALCAPNYAGGAGEQFVKEQLPKSGNTLLLTIDLALQQQTEQALKQGVLSSAKENVGGAAVVLEVHTGEILASASYPTYDLETFSKEYHTLTNNPANPMFHRAFSGLYAPGSTFKPISAIAAMEKGVLTTNETIETRGEYPYKNHTFYCNIYRTRGEMHGNINVSEALGVSCNCFFYETAVRTGIDDIVKTASAFGLNATTGSALPEEAKGVIASPETREKCGGIWYPGDALQAAIGQSDNLFTPVLLANYAAALANGGTVYRTQLLKSVQTPNDHRTIYESTPEILTKASVSAETLAAVKDGMQKTTEANGTAAGVFADFPISVAGKTGSAQVPNGTNGLFICYAPAENPQIAVSVVLEKGDSGVRAAQVAKEILEAYFHKAIQTTQTAEASFYTLLP